MKTRSADRGIATNEIGIVSVVLLVVGVIAINGWYGRNQPSLDCLAIAAGGGVQGRKCPVSQEAFAGPVCPDPRKHLQWPPRFERGRSRQELPPAPAGATLETGRTATFIAARQNGPTMVLDVRPRFWWRYLVGPLLQILCVLFLISFFYQFHPDAGAPRGVIVMSGVAALFSGFLLWVTVPDVEGSQAIQIDPAARRVVRHRYLFGMERTPEVYASEFAPVFVRTKGGCSLVLVRDAGGKPEAVELIDGLSDDDAVLGAWVRARFPN